MMTSEATKGHVLGGERGGRQRGRTLLRPSPLRDRRAVLAMAGPGLILAVALSIVVLTNAIWLILHYENLLSPRHQFIGATNFKALVHDHTLRSSLVTTAIYVGVALPIEAVLGIGVSLLIHYGVPGERLVRSLLIVPMVLAPLIVGLLWRLLYDPSAGLLDYLLGQLGWGGKTAWLANPHTALWAVIASDVWEWTPFIIIIALAALESLPREPLEAAEIDGANALERIRYIVLPLIRPALAIAVFLRLIGLLNSFPSIWAMTKGGPGTSTMTLNVYGYQQGFELFAIGYATTMCLLYGLLITFGIMPLARRLLGFAEEVKPIEVATT